MRCRRSCAMACQNDLQLTHFPSALLSFSLCPIPLSISVQIQRCGRVAGFSWAEGFCMICLAGRFSVALGTTSAVVWSCGMPLAD